ERAQRRVTGPVRPALASHDLGSKRNSLRITMPPGHALLWIAGLFLPRKQYRRVEEHVADLREEVYEALMTGRRVRARLLPVTYLIAIIFSLLSWIPAKLLERITKPSRE